MQEKSFGEWLKKKMGRKVSVEDLRDFSGVTTGQIKAYLDDIHLPSLKAAGKLAIALRVKPEEFWRAVELSLNGSPHKARPIVS